MVVFCKACCDVVRGVGWCCGGSGKVVGFQCEKWFQ